MGISGLLSGDRGDGVEAVTGGLTFNSTQGFSQFNEVVGLCSGAFPTTQATGNIGRPLQSVLGGDESQNAVLNWATKQKEGDGYYGDSESEDEDMPLIKKKRVKLKVKNSNRCVRIHTHAVLLLKTVQRICLYSVQLKKLFRFSIACTENGLFRQTYISNCYLYLTLQ